jgi:hypothetical protein
VNDYPWYEAVEGEQVDQGDCFFALPIIRPVYDARALDEPPEEHDLETNISYLNCIVMTQACDLAYDKVDEVTLCPFQALEGFQAANPTYNNKGAVQRIQRGREPALHLLNEWDDPPMALSVVSFREIYSVPYDFVRAFAARAGRRLRLLPPYREHLSQAFARYFMRVGLPQEIELPG